MTALGVSDRENFKSQHSEVSETMTDVLPQINETRPQAKDRDYNLFMPFLLNWEKASKKITVLQDS